MISLISYPFLFIILMVHATIVDPGSPEEVIPQKKKRGRDQGESSSHALAGPTPRSSHQNRPSTENVSGDSSFVNWELKPNFTNHSICPHHFISLQTVRKMFPRVAEIISFQKLGTLLSLRNTLYSENIYEFYSNLDLVKSGLNPFEDSWEIRTKVQGIDISFDKSLLGNLIRCPSNAGLYYHNDYLLDINVENFSRLQYAIYRENLVIQYNNSAHSLTFANKIMHFLLTKCIIPVSSSFDRVNVSHFFYLYCFAKNLPVCLPLMIMLHMRESIVKANSALPYGCLITQILRHFGVPQRGTVIKPKQSAELFVGKFLSQMDIRIIKDDIIVWQKIEVSGKNFKPLPPDVETENFHVIDDQFYRPEAEPKPAPEPEIAASCPSSSRPSSSRPSRHRSPSPPGCTSGIFRAFFRSFLRSSRLQREELRRKALRQQEKHGTEPDFTALNEASDEDAQTFEKYFGNLGDGGGDGGASSANV